jgi:polyisoprenoid-binding protein YceI
MVSTPTAATVESGNYTLETSHARTMFSVSHMGFSTWYGEFPGAVGTLDLDTTDLRKSRLSVSVETAGINSNNAVLDAMMRGVDWFDSAKFPEITFVSKEVIPTGDTSADVIGELTMHGVTKSVTLHASFNTVGTNPLNQAYTIGFEVTGTIKRSDFGVSAFVPAIGDEVTLIISAPFEKQ